MLKKILARIQDHFGISRKEARGAFVLIVVCLLLLWLPFIFRSYILPHFTQPADKVAMEKLDSIYRELQTVNRYPNTKNRSPANREYAGAATTAIKLTPFNPNTASVAELTSLGVPPFLAKRIEKFRLKGGKFKKKEDLQRIYDFPEDLYQQLIPYILLEKIENAPKNEAERSSYAAIKPTGQKPAGLNAFDINTADTTQLIRLKGIGSKLSARIIKFRDGLGGFHAQEQFAEIFGLDSLALKELTKYALVQSPVRKVDINHATAAELGNHSYLKNKKLVAVIVNYRNQHGDFKDLNDLKNVKVLDEALLRKLAPYLSF